MSPRTISTLLALCIAISSLAQQQMTSNGTIKRFESFSSKYVQPRNVDVWLPGDYDSTQRYSVLYMNDGQMLFDSTKTWNGQEWKVDETISGLLSEGKIRGVIVVGIWNNGAYRHSEYFPQKPLANLPDNIRTTVIADELMNKPQADNYLLFLANELKPFIDKTFSTYTDRSNTFIAGSSMGGLISLYALCEYPSVFGGAACISTHWPGSLKQKGDLIPGAFNKYLTDYLPLPAGHKIYFDYGTETLDSSYKPFQLMVDKTMKEKGYSSKNWITKEFTGHDHSEKAWAKRLGIPLLFLLGKENNQE